MIREYLSKYVCVVCVCVQICYGKPGPSACLNLEAFVKFDIFFNFVYENIIDNYSQ